ncbi:MAG TPA: hypothetical protein PKD16_18160 [Saprospiraceae bacterium]|jgi:hypothetical protein|nr:hypothetical protein [Saprospiraceae bacterium]HMT72099.1 hypothetical protein [Saprospiraceae bacterium]
MTRRLLPINETTEVEETVDFTKFKVKSVSEDGYLRVSHPYTYFKFDYKNEFKGLLMYCIEADIDGGDKEIQTDDKTISVIFYPGVDQTKDLSDLYKSYFHFYSLINKDKCFKYDGWFDVI